MPVVTSRSQDSTSKQIPDCTLRSVGYWFLHTSWYRTWENVLFWMWCSRWSAPKPI